MRRDRTPLIKRLNDIGNDIMRDMALFEKYADMSVDVYFGTMETVSVISYKVLMGYSLSVIKENDKEIFELILELCSSYPFYELKLNEGFYDLIMEFEQDIYFHNIEFLEMLSLFGWKVMRYNNLDIIDKRIDYFDIFPEDAAAFILSKAEMVIDDSDLYDGNLNLIVLQYDGFGKYRKYANFYPGKRNSLLHDLIYKTVDFLRTQISAWYNDFCGDIVSQENIYYSVFTMGYYGEMNQYAGLNFNMPGCLLAAYYLHLLLEIAKDMLPGYQEYVGNLA